MELRILNRKRKKNVYTGLLILMLAVCLLAGMARPVSADDWDSQAPQGGWSGQEQDGGAVAPDEPGENTNTGGGWQDSGGQDSGGQQYDAETQDEGYDYAQTYGSYDNSSQGTDDGAALGSQYVNDYFGFTRSDLVIYLLEHEDEYIGTPYDEEEGESQTPGPDGHMQCEGFVWNVLHAVAQENSDDVPCWEGADTSPYGNGGGWVTWIYNHNIVYYTFSTKEEMLESGVLEKGDIIWSFDEGGPLSVSDYHHVGIFWGDSSDDDVFWHSNEFAFTETYEGEEGTNRISRIEGATENVSVWWVVKLSEDDSYEENLEAYEEEQSSSTTKKALTAQSASSDSSTDSASSESYAAAGSGAEYSSSSDSSGSGELTTTGQSSGSGFSLFAWIGGIWEKIVSGIKNFLDSQ